MADKTLADWQKRATKIQIDGRAFINGRRVDSTSGETRTTINPANGQPLVEVANCGTRDADEAIRIARATFEKGVWSGMSASDRKSVLVRWAEVIEQHAEELALLETLDVGKPIADTVNVDVPSSVRTIRWTGEAINKVYDQISPTRDNCLGLITRLPLGVVAAIVPWNFPLSTTAWKLAPALAVYYNGGQTCTAGTRLIVQESIHDAFIEKVVDAAKGWAPGNPLDPGTAMGPMIDQSQCRTVADYVEIGRNEGAQLLAGGGTVMEETGGFYHEPTIFSDVNNQMRIAQEEIFGPVLSVLTFKDAEDAVQIANDSIYGLAGAVWSRDINTAHKVADKVRVGTMGINNYFGGDITVPFGGFKESGNGRDKSMHAFDDYTELKTTWIEFD